MIDAGQHKGKLLDHTKQRTFHLVMSRRRCRQAIKEMQSVLEDLFLIKLNSLLIMCVILFLFSRQQIASHKDLSLASNENSKNILIFNK